MKPTNGKPQPTTQVKVLSPEILLVRKADSFHMLEGNTRDFALVSDLLLSRGLSPWDVAEWLLQELGRSIWLFRWNYGQTSVKGKNAQMTMWKSDYPIVVWKRGNARVAKGITLQCRGKEKRRLASELEPLWKRY